MGAETGARLLDGLTEAQTAAVISDGAPLVILAGAGSGKTRVLTRRIAWRVAEGTAESRHTLALTFTRKAAGELRSRLAQLGVRDQVAAGTFHAIAYAQLRQRWADRAIAPPSLLQRKVPLVAELRGRVRDAAVPHIDLVSEIEWAKARLVSPERYEDDVARIGRSTPIAPAPMAALYARYEEEKKRRRLVDFDDLLLLCARALRDDTEFAAAQRWRFRHLFVDEFQDVNPAQAALLDGWRGGSSDLCVVGDPNQAIYGWNGAEPTYLTAFCSREPDATVVRLDDNFRSSPQILAVATAVLGDADGDGLRAHRSDGRLPVVRSYADERAEAVAVARTVRDRRRPGTSWSSIAVLARTNAQLVVLEEALRAGGVPYRVRGGAPFLDRPEVADALNGLRRRPGTFAERLSWLNDTVLEDDHDDGTPAAAERRGNVAEVVRLGQEYLAAGGAATVEGFTAWLDATLRGDNGSATAADGVELATFHAAKGLEWPVVFLVGLERGLVPIGHAKTPEAEAEERRLLYVAVTRAEDELHCSWARERTFGERALKRAPSPWLDDISVALKALQQGLRPADLRARIADERRRLAVARTKVVGEDADPAVLDALKAWRRSAAKAAGVPAYVIFHDTTLAAVAEAQPSNREALLRLPGLGPVKAARYGDDLLRVVRDAAAS